MSLETFEKLPAEKKERILSAGIREFSRNSYKDANTDRITKECQISKGILFHYFGSKKGFYLYCLERSMERLVRDNGEVTGTDFYVILFESMNRKLSLCMQYPDEMHMVNMASRETATEIAEQKTEVLGRYMAAVQSGSEKTLNAAMAALTLRSKEKRQIAVKGLHIYIRALLNNWLMQYQQTPDLFFARSEQIRQEMKDYLDLMLYGICKENAQ